ncbi:hypothetical protein NC651_025410 [Populus alba x Populus x berolinensis]|nr:hypothetical protein NC651_025410 [Populus alba x Populus x berolinensis]
MPAGLEFLVHRSLFLCFQISLFTDLFTCSFPGRMSQYYRRPSP